jgi:PAS domain S-box-containing protein
LWTLEKNKSSENKNKAASLIDLFPDSVVIVDPQGKIVAANKVVGKYTGYKSEDLIGKNLFEQGFFEEETRAILQENMKKRLKGSPIPCYEIKIKAKNGEFQFLEIKGNKIEYEGQICDLILFYDVTERSNNQKKLQQELLESEEKSCGITNSIRDAVILVNNEAKVIYWNPAAEKTFGYTTKEATGKYVHELVIPKTMCKEGKGRIDTCVKVFGQTGMGYFTVGNVEVLGRRKDGSEFPAELAMSSLKLGEKWHAVGVVQDITLRKREEQKLREAEQRYHALFNQAPLGISILDPETTAFAEFNDVAHLQLGYTREEFEKLTIYDITGEENKSIIKSRMDEILKTGAGEFETKHRDKNGNIRNVLASTLTLQLAGKTFVHAVFHDVTETRKVQNDLIESEARYRQLVELAQEGIWAVDNELNTVFVNPRLAQMLGYSQSEMVGRNLVDFLDKDMVEKIIKIFEKFDRSGIKGQYECAFLHRNGSHLNTSLAVSTITDDQGKVIGKLALVADITARKQMENELRASEERFRAISTSAMDAIILVDAADVVIYWNPAAEKTFGYSEKEALGRQLAGLIIPSQERAKHQAILQEIIQKLSLEKHYEFMAIKKDRTSLSIEVSVTSLMLNDRSCMLAIARDVSDRKTMEDALKQERDMLENMAASIDAGLTLISKDYRVLWANQLLKQANGNKLENEHCYSIYDQSDRICPDCGVRKVFENGVAVDRHDYRLKVPGRDEWVELIVTPVKDKDGKVVAALELAVNITERKRLQNKLAEYSQRLEELVQQRTEQLKLTQAELVKSERLAAIGELAGMVGHDLRNPLSGIKNSAYFLKKKGPDISPAQAKEMLDIIDKCVDYSNKIVNDLLDYSREIHLELQECSPRQMVLESLDMIQVPENVKIVNNLLHKQTLKADPDKLKRVFINLIRNAIDAMPDGGKLTICGKVKGDYEISFEDTGTGIKEEVLPKLFSPLFTTKAKGMGFGLAICKRIVEAHGGSITVKTVKNQGTTFTIALPIEPKLEVGGEKIWVNMPQSSLSMTTKT